MDGVRGAEEHSLMLSERYLIIAHRKTRDRLRPGITDPLLCTSIIVAAAMRGITKERTPQSTLVNQQGSQCQYYRRSGFRHGTLHDCTRQSRAHIHSQVNVEECKPKSKKANEDSKTGDKWSGEIAEVHVWRESAVLGGGKLQLQKLPTSH